MQNIINYVENAFLTFDEKPLTRVDSLVFSALTYLRYEIVFENFLKNNNAAAPFYLDRDYDFFSVRDGDGKPVQLYFYNFLNTDYYSGLTSPGDANMKRLLTAVTNSPRFRSVRLAFYVNKFDKELEMQFAAVTFILSNNSSYVAFRGTDSSLVGWKEDFNMAYECPVPAQSAASIYLNAAAPYLPKTIYVGGHSKGGNLAVYSLLKAENNIKERIKCAFSHDGPGFRTQIVESDEFKKISGKIEKTVPQDSLVGMLLQSGEDYQVIKSSAKFINEHDPFTWEVLNGDFITLKSITPTSQIADKALSQWIESMSDEKRKLFTSELFRILSASNAATFDDMKKNWAVALPSMALALKSADGETRGIMIKLLSDLANIFKSTIFS